MADQLRCPVCRDLMRESGAEQLLACLTCDLHAPPHVAQLLAADRAELVRLRNGFAEGVTPLNRALADLAEDLRERARAAERAAGVADDGFDVQGRDGFRERATTFRVAARLVEQLVAGEPPRKAAGHG